MPLFGQKNFVELYKSALSNEIKLWQYERNMQVKKKPFVTKEQLDEIIKNINSFHLYDEEGNPPRIYRH